MEEVIESQQFAFSQLEKNSVVPLRINIQNGFGSTLFMPASIGPQGNHPGALGLKVVSVRPENQKRNMDTLPAIILMVDPQTGYPVAALDAGYLTSLRTAAASAVATRLLANPETRKVAIFGAGPVAYCHAQAMMCIRGASIQEIVIWNRTAKKAQELAQKLSSEEMFSKVRIYSEECPNAAVKGADLIITATSSEKPLFDGRNIKPGAHLNCVGSFLPTMQEVNSTSYD
eukprot:TRINITY_DN8535_c0_g1_i1.p1 TRINITY_DN8535_c0_g1~~TRINITY_DN8535_c0_g1_i1.p1  ORF type:complete len:262 (+),score=41.28 TRINITY_DN8535_c0_g1_i1:97-786(+)